ncbi:MAG: RHS repeat protein [Butyrivibrio sp.]|nr:RHS repeat protein [Butyrivibrio sp.]
MGFTKENLYTNIPGAGNVFTGSDQIWDQAQIKAFFELILYQLAVFDAESEKLTRALDNFMNDDDHKGKEARASKKFVEKKYLPVIIDTIRAVQLLKGMTISKGIESCTPILDDFKEALSENDDAIFTRSKLEKIIIDFSSYNRCFAENTPKITNYRNTAQGIIDSCDVIKSIKTLDDPDPMPAQEELDEFTTGDGKDGDIPLLMKAFMDFLEEHNDDFTGTEFVGLVEKIITNLNGINDGLGNGIYKPGDYERDLKKISYEQGSDTEEYKAYIKTYKKFIEGKVASSQVYIYDPVNVNSGSFVSEKSDLVISGPHGIELKRFYNSQKERSGVLGKGWTLNFEERITRDDEDTITLFYGDGKVGCFKKVTLGKEEVYLEIHGAQGILREIETGYKLSFDNNRYIEYDAEGYLVSFGDGFGPNISVEYNVFEKNADGKVTSAPLPVMVKTKEGKSISFAYNNDGLLVKATDHTKREILYSYVKENDAYRLTSVTGPDGNVKSYTYTADGLIQSATRPDGIVGITNEYDAQGRVKRQITADGGEFIYSYNDADHVTIVTEPGGCKVEYVSDEAGRHIATRYPEFDLEESYSYNDKGFKISHTDKRGFTTRYTYDNRGHVTGIIGPEGLSEFFTYNADGRLISKKDSEGNTITYRYDLQGNLYSVTDQLGETVKYDYEDGRLIAVRDAEGDRTTYTYDDQGNIASITGPDGLVTSYFYDALGRVIATEDTEGNRTSYELDVNGNIIKATDPEGNVTEYSYTALGKIAEVINPDGTRRHWDYNTAGKKSAFTDEENRVTRYLYNHLYQEEKVILPNSGTVLYEYDKLGYRIAETNAEGVRTEYAYDKGGNRISTAKAAGSGDDKKKIVVSTLTYDARGRVTAQTDGEGNTTGYVYDRNSNIIEKTNPAGGRTSYEYDAAGRLIKTIDPLGREIVLTYTKDGRLRSSTDHDGVTTVNIYENKRIKKVVKRAGEREILVREYEYDPCGRVRKLTGASGLTVEYVYDRAGRITETLRSDGRHVTCSYDACGRVVETTDCGNTTRYTYTGTGRIKSVTDPLGNVTQYSYNELDLLESVDRSGGHVTTYDRNLVGDIISVTDGLGQKDVFTYDEFGRVSTHVDRDGNVTAYTRDNNGNTTSLDYSDGKSVRLKYDALNKLEEIRDHLGVTTISNDIIGRMTGVTDYSGRTVGYEYGLDDRRTAVIYPDGRTARYSYDEFGRLSLLSNVSGDNDTEESVTYTYDDIGRLSVKSFPNGTSIHYDYYPGGNIKTLTSMEGEDIIDKYEYHYVNSVRSSVTRHRRGLDAVSGTYDYTYDALGRLLRTSHNGVLKASYEYDAFGNRVRMEVGDEVTEYRYDALNRLTESVMTASGSPAENMTYGYDRRGHLTSVTKDGVIRKTFDYDVAGMMVHAHDDELGDAVYDYNGMGYRARCVRPEEETEYLCDLSREYYNLLERTVNGQRQSFVYDRNVISMNSEEGNFYYLQDELGSTMYLTGTDGRTVESYAYDDFGGRVDPFTENGPDEKGSHGYNREGNILQPFAFTGYQEDTVSGLQFAQARYYDNKTGRFTGEDMIGGIIQEPYTQNRYVYCLNNPVGYVDLNGKEPYTDPEKEREDIEDIVDAFQNHHIIRTFKEHGAADKDAVNHAGTNTTIGCLTDDVNNKSDGDAEYVGVVYLLARDGAAGQGHAAIALVKNDGMADVYSIDANPSYNPVIGLHLDGYFGTNIGANGEPESIDFNEYLRTGNLPHDSAMHRGSNQKKQDIYTHFIYQPITNEEGIAMKGRADALRKEYTSYDFWNYKYMNRWNNHYNVLDNNCGQNTMIVMGDKAFAYSTLQPNLFRSKPNVQYQEGVYQINNGMMTGYYGTIEQLRMAFCEV